MSKVTDLNKKHTPLEIAQAVPWDSIEKVIVIYETPDGCILHVSEMDWKTRLYLSGELQNLNAAERASCILRSEES